MRNMDVHYNLNVSNLVPKVYYLWLDSHMYSYDSSIEVYGTLRLLFLYDSRVVPCLATLLSTKAQH